MTKEPFNAYFLLTHARFYDFIDLISENISFVEINKKNYIHRCSVNLSEHSIVRIPIFFATDRYNLNVFMQKLEIMTYSRIFQIFLLDKICLEDFKYLSSMS